MTKLAEMSQEQPDDGEFRAAVEAGLASLDAGRKTPFETVGNWLLSWGTDHELPAPE